MFQANELEQKEYELKVAASSAALCRITVAQESDVYVGLSFTPNPSLDAPNTTVMFGNFCL
jgi:hypothetical protein